jgi:hypothetical protein
MFAQPDRAGFGMIEAVHPRAPQESWLT